MKCTDAHRKTQVTISIPREAGDTLKYLAKFNTQLLERLGILAIRVDGCETVSVCTKPREQVSQGHLQTTPTLSGGLCMDLVKDLARPIRRRYRKQASECNVGSSKQSCDKPSVPFEGRSRKILTSPCLPNVGLDSCQDPKPGQRVMEPGSSVFQTRYFNQHCSVNNISSDPCPSFAPATAFGRSHFYFEHPKPGWNLTEQPNDMNSSALKSAGLFHVLSSSNNVPTTSNLQSTSSIGSEVFENACMKVPKVRQKRKAKQSSSLRNYCVDVESPFHQMTSASFSKRPPVPEEVSDYFGGNISSNLVRPPCKRHVSPSSNVNKSTNLAESLSESDLSVKKYLSHFTNQQLKFDSSVAPDIANVSPSSLTAINSEANNVSVVAFPSNLKSSADCLISDNSDLSEVKRSCSSGGFKETTESTVESSFLTLENSQQTVALQSSTSFHLDEKSGLLISLSPRVQSSSFVVGDGVGAMPNCESMVLRHVLEGTNDETCIWPSENVGKVDDVELCNNFDQLPLETFKEEQVHVLDENHQENCLDFQLDSSEDPGVSEVDADVLKSDEEFCNKMTVCAKENLTMSDSDELNIRKVNKLSKDRNDEFTLTDAIGLSSLQQPANTSGNCVAMSAYRKVGIENVGKESFNLEMEIPVVAEDTCKSDEYQIVGNISPDSAVVGDVASVETIEENETLSVSLPPESLPLDRHMEPFCNDSAMSSTDLVITNHVGYIRDHSYNSLKDIHKSSGSSDANDCESVVGMIETDELNAVKFARVNDSTNNIHSDNDVPRPMELTWSKLTKEDFEVIKLNNKHSALDLAVTHFEGVSRCSKSVLSEDLRRLDALVLCEFDSVVVNPSSLFCVAKVADGANSKAPRNGNKCITRKLSEPLKINKRPFSIYSLLAKRRMKRRIVGNIPALNREYGHLNRCEFSFCSPDHFQNVLI